MALELEFLRDMTIALTLAVIGGFAASRLRLSPIVGYLIAGIIISPATPGIVLRQDFIEALAHLGLIFLLFSIGLGFSLAEVRAVGKVAGAEILLLVVLGLVLWFACWLAHYPHAVTMSISMIISSTAIGIALLRQWNIEHHRVGKLVISIAVVEDLVAIALVVYNSTPAASLSPVTVVLAVVKALVFVGVAVIIGRFALGPLTSRLITRAPANALFGAFCAIALLAAWAGHFAGLSFEFGAFIAGAVIGEATAARVVQSIIAPFRELFVSLFFVAVGMLFDPELVLPQWAQVLGIGAAFIVVRWVGFSLLGIYAGLTRRQALLLGMALVPLGEFNVMLIDAALASGRVGPTEEAAVLGVTFLTITVAMLSGPLLRPLAERIEPSAAAAEPGGHGEQQPMDVVVVGYGRIGRTVCEVFRRENMTVGTIDLTQREAAAAQAAGFYAIVGDAANPTVLDRVVGPDTRAVISTSRDPVANEAVARRVAATSGAVLIVRARDPGQIPRLRELGATEAIVTEVEGSLALSEAAMRSMGIPDDERHANLRQQRAAMIASSRDLEGAAVPDPA